MDEPATITILAYIYILICVTNISLEQHLKVLVRHVLIVRGTLAQAVLAQEIETVSAARGHVLSHIELGLWPQLRRGALTR